MLSSQQLGERIGEERRRRGTTQADLASQLGISRQTLIAVEKGERRPAPDELLRIAELLKVSIHDLQKEYRVGGQVSPRFRAKLDRVDRQSSALQESVDLLERLGRQYVELERLNAIPRVRSPIDALETYRDTSTVGTPPRLAAEDAARTLRAMFGFGDGSAADIESRLASEAGLRIFCIDLPSSVAGVFIWGDEIGACVAINRRHPPERRRWSLAHETGHFLRDRDAGDILTIEPPGRSDPSDFFAEAFARELLLPAAGVTRRFAETLRSNASRFTPLDLKALARSFGVSLQAMSLRLEELELLPAGTYDRLRRRKLRPGGVLHVRSQEPMDGTTLPERYVALAIAALEEGKLSEGSFAKYLMTDRVTARGIYLEHRRLRVDDLGTSVDSDLATNLHSVG